MRIFLGLLLLFAVCALQAQPCDGSMIAQTKGSWKKGVAGSTSGVSPANLAREREFVANIMNRLQQRFTPLGFDISYTGVYGYPNPDLVRNRKADEYAVSMAILPLYCENGRLQHSIATPYWLSVEVNIMPIQPGQSLFVQTKPDEEDPGTDALATIDSLPVKDKGIWLLKQESYGKPTTDYRWIISYNNELPFRLISRQEVCQRLIPYFKKKIEYARFDHEKSHFQRRLGYAEEYMKNTPQHELQQPALVRGTVLNVFNDLGDNLTTFFNPGEHAVSWVVENNRNYFIAAMPLHTPQLITVRLEVSEKNELLMQNIRGLLEALDFNSLVQAIGRK